MLVYVTRGYEYRSRSNDPYYRRPPKCTPNFSQPPYMVNLGYVGIRARDISCTSIAAAASGKEHGT